jgi:hypothetical protein
MAQAMACGQNTTSSPQSRLKLWRWLQTKRYKMRQYWDAVDARQPVAPVEGHYAILQPKPHNSYSGNR